MTCDTQCSVGIACVEGIRDDAEKCCFVIVCALHKWEDWLQLMLVSTIPMNPHPRAAVFCRNNVNSSGLSCRLNPLGFYNTKQKVVFVSRTGGACPKVSFTGTCVSCRPLFGRVVGVKKWCRVCWVDFQTLFFNPFSGMKESWFFLLWGGHVGNMRCLCHHLLHSNLCWCANDIWGGMWCWQFCWGM